MSGILGNDCLGGGSGDIFGGVIWWKGVVG